MVEYGLRLDGQALDLAREIGMTLVASRIWRSISFGASISRGQFAELDDD